MVLRDLALPPQDAMDDIKARAQQVGARLEAVQQRRQADQEVPRRLSARRVAAGSVDGRSYSLLHTAHSTDDDGDVLPALLS
jgi:hypothetical protein